MSEFTKGPWRLNKQFDTFLCVDSQCHSMVCDIDCNTNHSTGLISPNEAQLANAHLIAAAPEMYEALSEALSMIERQPDFNDDGDGLLISRCKQALAKAVGASQ